MRAILRATGAVLSAMQRRSAGAADDALMRHLKPRRVQDDLRGVTPVQGRDCSKAWRLICAHASERDLIRSHPSVSVRRLAPPEHPARPHDQLEAFRARWQTGTRWRACMVLLRWTGARIGDAVSLGLSMVGRDGVLTFRQQKAGNVAHGPWTCGLPAHVAQQAGRDRVHEALGDLSTGRMTFLAPRNGRTRSAKAMGHVIAAAAAGAGLDRSGHELRKGRAVALAEGGANPLQIEVWTGHHSLSEVTH